MLPPLASRIGLAVAAASTMLLGSAGHAMDLPALIGRADTASDATVYLVPPMALFRAALDEARMQAVSCRYTTSDPAAIRALAGLIQAGHPGVNAIYQRPDIREGVYLTLADGSQLKFLLQDNFGGRLPVSGVAEVSADGALQTVGVTADQTLAVDLRKWAAMRGGPGTGSACDRQSSVAGPTGLAPPQ